MEVRSPLCAVLTYHSCLTVQTLHQADSDTHDETMELERVCEGLSQMHEYKYVRRGICKVIVFVPLLLL